MNFFDGLAVGSYKENTIKVNLVDPRTKRKMIDSKGDNVFVEMKGAQSQAWRDQASENGRYTDGMDKEDITDEMRVDAAARTLAASTVAANLPDIAIFKVGDLEDNATKQQIQKKLRKFYVDYFPSFSTKIIEKCADDAAFMQKPEESLSTTNHTEGGVTLTT